MAVVGTRRLRPSAAFAGSSVLLLSQLQAASAQAATPTPTRSPEILGCFHYGYQHNKLLQGSVPVAEKSAQACQGKCAQTPNCDFFTFHFGGTENYRCDLHGAGSLLELPANIEEGLEIVSGPKQCPPAAANAAWVDEGQPVTSACTGIPQLAFPGKTAALSAAAFGGEVPTMGQCWPHDGNGMPMMCPNSKPVVLEDTATGWPGVCGHLSPVPGISTQEQCKEYCFSQPLCSVWQYNGGTECLVGEVGAQYPFTPAIEGESQRRLEESYTCYNRPNFKKPVAAQRIMHGTYRLFMDLKGVRIKGLTKMFGTEVFKNETLAAYHCRLYCIGQLTCQWWQYNSATGCWAEDVNHFRVPYPLIDDPKWVEKGTDMAKSVIDGEYIQHLCGGQATPRPTAPPYHGFSTPAPTPAAKTHESFPFGVWGIVGGVALIGFFGVGAGVIMVLSSRKTKGRRPGKGDQFNPAMPSGAGTQLEDTAPLMGADPPSYQPQPQYAQPTTMYNTQQSLGGMQPGGFQFQQQPVQSLPQAPTQMALPQGYAPSYTPGASYTPGYGQVYNAY